MGLFSNKSKEISKLISKADMLVQNSNYEELVKCGEQIISIEPNNADGWSAMGNGYLNLDKFEECIPCFENAVKIDPMGFIDWHQLAIAFESVGKIEQAISALYKAVETNPDNLYNRKEIALESIEYLKNLDSNNSESDEIQDNIEQEIMEIGDIGVRGAFNDELATVEMALDRLDMIRINGEKKNLQFTIDIATRQINRIRKAMKN